jgi:hypothetical protein
MHETVSRRVLFDLRFEIFTAVKIQVEVFWVVMPCSVVVGYQPRRPPLECF